ncbi:MAG: hypothetical protein AMXMBFR33_72990 [Candidatus Xenobia bacterium]|jgi:hypothetical protein
MNNKTVDSVRTGLRRLALGTVIGAMVIGGVACGGSPAPTPTDSPTATSTGAASPSPGDTSSPSSSTGTQGASETVSITDTGAEAPATGTPAASPTPRGSQPLARPVQQQITRDPFVNPLTGGGASLASRPTVRATPRVTAATPGSTAAATPGTKASPGAQDAAEPEEEVPPPDVTVTGIVMGAGRSFAIVTGPEQSYIVGVGDKLVEYRILAISPQAVTFGLKSKKFKVKLQDEFGADAAGTKATAKGR